MNKKTILICALVLVLLVVGFFAWKQSRSEKTTAPSASVGDQISTEGSSNEPVSAEVGGVVQNPENTGELTNQEEDSSSVVILENEGEIEIIIPDDQESDGF